MVLKSDPFAFSPTAFSPVALADMTVSLRAFTEHGLQQARDGNGAIGAAYHSAARGAGDYTAKLLEIARTNVEGAFDFAQALLGSTSVADAVELTARHARRQFETLASQSQDLIQIGQKVASEAVDAAKALPTGT